MNFTPTDEQAAALDAFRTQENMLINAGAGTGKTTQLKLMALDADGARGNYIAYNRAIRDEAKATFPANTKCNTAHQLAFGPVGSKFKKTLDMDRQRPGDVAKILGAQAFKHGDNMLNDRAIARLALDTVSRFCYSADDDLKLKHVPWVENAEEFFDDLKHHVLPFALKAWGELSNPHGRLKSNPDHFLKIWAMGHPKIRADFLLYDEAQDANPCMSAVVLEQDAQLIAVGDQCQAIYTWRGAEDAMKHWPAKHKLVLSQSFRFGPPVANEANKWLDLLDAPLRLTGFDKLPTEIVEEMDDPDAILCRTNAQVMAEAFRADEDRKRFAVVGGTGEIQARSYGAMNLLQGRKTDHPDLAAFSNWQEVQEYTEEKGGGGADLKVFVKLIDAYGPERIIEIAKRAVDEKKGNPQITLSTAHKAKGREWGKVKIATDFKEPGSEDGGTTDPKLSRSEAMLAYVTVTRAQTQLNREGLAWVDEWEGRKCS